MLGTEVLLWGEENDDYNTLQKIWPRAAAAAERTWSDPLPLDLNGWAVAERRLHLHRERLVRNGVDADAQQPRWCLQNGGDCPLGPSETDLTSTAYKTSGVPQDRVEVGTENVLFESNFAGAV